MSDWGAVHATIPSANAGLDQESGYPFDRSPYFSDALREAIAGGHVPLSRLDAMAGHILYSMFANGLFDEPTGGGPPDFQAHARISRAAAEGSMVLLKNDHSILPFASDLASIAVIGSHADIGVLSGGGSSQVYAQTGFTNVEPDPKHGPRIYFRSSPLNALMARTHAKVLYDEGKDPATAALLASRCKVAIVFAHQWSAEGMDGTLQLDDDQDSLIAAIAKANANTIVVLETGGPVLMPWLSSVAGVLEAWYPGSSGGEAIARILTGEVNPSGRLPLTFPRSTDQLPRPPAFPTTPDSDAEQTLDPYPTVDYDIEGAAVGYKWYEKQGVQPLFPFGFGLSYSRFAYTDLKVETVANRIVVHVEVSNTGRVAGAEVAQLYIGPRDPSAGNLWEAKRRLAGFVKVNLKPGERRRVSVTVEPLLTGFYDETRHRWRIAAGDYEVTLSKDATHSLAQKLVHLDAQALTSAGS
jgi:beta-glucosidase